MAAGVPPANFGGGHAFMADPQEAGLSTAVRDLTAQLLQMAHYVRAQVDAGDHAGIDAIAAAARNTLAASTASQARERATRELQPVTRLPAAAWGVEADISRIRLGHVPAFEGTANDTIDVVRWMSRIFSLAHGSTLTWAAGIELMIQASKGGAADYIEQMRDEGKTIQQIVQQLEMRYGDLCTPEEARVKCNNMPRKEKEGLSEFIDRLRRMARMACRLEADDAARTAAMDVLVEGNIRRVLPNSVRNALEERVINRSRMGLPAFNAREIEKECLELERRRDERRNVYVEPVGKKGGNVRLLQSNQEGDLNAPMDQDFMSSAEEVDTDDDATYSLVNEIKQQERRYMAKGKPLDPKKIYSRAFRRYNQRLPAKGRPPYQPGVRQAGMMGNHPSAQQGPPNRLDGAQRRTIHELLALANCPRGHCIQCGFEGHYMHNDACALKDKPLVDKACAKCNTGLHSADDCPKVFQQKYVAPQQANLVYPEENLNQQ